MDSINTLKIITHPQSQGAVNGDRVTFGVVAEGPGQLSYEWLKDGVPINDKSTSCVYTIESFVPAEHKGSYQCIVSSDGDDASQSVDLAMSLKAELKDLSPELERAASFQKPLTVVFIGRVGRGKSTLINSLFGRAVVVESNSVYPVSQDILTNTYQMNDIEVITVDTPGFMPASPNSKSSVADTMKAIAEKIPAYNVDLVVYCLRMTDTFDGVEEHIIGELTRTYGEKIWSHSLFALTFANEVKQSRNEQLGAIASFKRRLGDMTVALQRDVLQKTANVSEEVANQVPVVPVGRPQQLKEGTTIDKLPDECNWFSNFWCRVLNRIHEPVKVVFNLHPFIKANDHRFLDQTSKT